MIYVDTHALVWFLTGEFGRLSPKAVRAIEGRTVMISPIVLLELQLLYDLGRLTDSPTRYAAELREMLGGGVCPMPFIEVVAASMSETWTRDPFDRLIVGHAKAAGAPLLTKDRGIRKHYQHAIW